MVMEAVNYDVFYEEYYPKFQRMAGRYDLSQDDSEDVAQDVCAYFWRRHLLEAFDLSRGVGLNTYIWGYAKYLVKEYCWAYRGKTFPESLDEDWEAGLNEEHNGPKGSKDMQDPNDYLDSVELQIVVENVYRSLSETRKKIFRARVYQVFTGGLPNNSELARELGISSVTVKYQIGKICDEPTGIELKEILCGLAG